MRGWSNAAPHKEEIFMRIRRRFAVVALLASALGVGAFAIMANGAIPKGTGVMCSTNAGQPSPSNTSCLNYVVSPSTGHSTTTRKNASLEVRVNTTYANPSSTTQGGFTATTQTWFDSDFGVNPGSIGKTCSKSQISTKTPKGALTTCGPLGTNNAWLSPSTSTAFNGFAHTNNGLNACVLAFNGPVQSGNPTITLYTRVYTIGGSPCPNPRTDTSTAANIMLSGKLTNTSAPFGKKLTVAGIPTSGDGLNDFDVKVNRGSYFTARCSGHNGTSGGSKFWKVKFQWHYSGTAPGNGQPDDVVTVKRNCSN